MDHWSLSNAIGHRCLLVLRKLTFVCGSSPADEYSVCIKYAFKLLKSLMD